MNDIILMENKRWKKNRSFLFVFYCDCCYYYCIFLRCLSLFSSFNSCKNRLLSATNRFVCLFNFDFRWRQMLNPNRAGMILIRNDHFGAPIEAIGIYIQEENDWAKKNTQKNTRKLLSSVICSFFHALCTFPPFSGGEADTESDKVMIIHGINRNGIQKHLIKGNKMMKYVMNNLLNRKKGK